MSARRWSQAWADALYGPEGFYRRPEGPAGHFATSAQGIPGVDAVLAQALLASAEQVDAEVVVDFGCGRGELLTTLAAFADADLALVGCDVVQRPGDLDARISWVTSPGGGDVPELTVLDGRRALVVAHEWLDVVPCDIVEVDETGRFREVLVEPDGRETLGQVVSPGSLDNDVPRRALEPGTRVELTPTRTAAWESLVAQVARHGAVGSTVLGIDYAVTRATAPPLGTLTGFRHGSECLPRPDGSCDLTSHVVLDALCLSSPPRRQREVLLDLFDSRSLDPVPIELARTDPPRYLEQLATRSAFTAATARGGLGDFAWFLRTV